MRTPHENAQYPQRLQKFLARAGIASRRGSENLMTAGRVTVNGQVVRELGTKIDLTTDIVAVDGKVIAVDSKPVYIMLNKPTGVLTTMDDPHGRPTVAQLIAETSKDDYPGLFPVGRLDLDTSGLLLMTTDGDMGHKLTHPKFEHYKTYEITVRGSVSPASLKSLQQGVMLEDGMTAPAKASYADDILTLSIREGRNRQVRRMCEAIGHPVVRLHRTHFATLSLGDLPLGEYRHLTDEEVQQL